MKTLWLSLYLMVKEGMFSLGSGTRQGAKATRQDKEIKDIQIKKEEVGLSLLTGDVIFYIENPM